MASFRDAYIAGNAEITALFAHPISDLFTSPPTEKIWAASLVKSIRDFNAHYDHHPSFEGNEAVVITGQQPAIFAGPLYSIYKAITTIKLAEKYTAQHNQPCVPIFWVGSEDHDFEEAATIHFPDELHSVRKLQLDAQSHHQDKPLNDVALSEQIHTLIDTLCDASISGEFREEIQTFLHESVRDADSLSDWSTRLLVRLFRNTSLVFFAPHLQAARDIAAPIIQQAIRNPLEVSRCVTQGAHTVRALGYTPQVEKANDECGFFLAVNDIRRKVVWRDNTFILPDLDLEFDESTLLQLLHDTPEAFSPNVALRCVVQQHLFPVAAYVAGPGELSYWGQFKSVFNSFDFPMPCVYPRAAAVLTTTKSRQLMEKYNLTLNDLVSAEEDIVTTALRTITESHALTDTTTMRADLDKLLSTWTDTLKTDSSPTPAAMAANLHEGIQHKLDRLERVILHIDTEKADTVRRHIRRLRNTLMPNKKPQERVYTVYTYLIKHGWDIMNQLLTELDIESFGLNEVEL